MSASGRDRDRQVIPRWRDLASTIWHRELGAAHTPLPVLDKSERHFEGLSERAREFHEHRSLSFAGDLLSASIVVGATSDTRAAAELVVASDASPPMLTQTAEWILSQARGGAPDTPAEQDDNQQRLNVAQLRRGLRANPRNAIRWVEMSRHYVSEGRKKRAENAMAIAVNIAPYDRYILRCAVRLWLHYSDAERAVHTLNHARQTVLADPWLLATEIAASTETDRPSRNIRRAREMVARASYMPIALSELTSALATIEMNAGAGSKARQLFRTALVDPNENSVAQAEWASSRLSGVDLGDKQMEQSAEARARRSAEKNDIGVTLVAAHEWLVDQPFSSEPAVFGSYHASMYQRFEDGVKFARAGLRPNPRSTLLLNNLAFCLAALGDLEEARKALKEVPSEDENKWRPTLTATRGFIAFRAGDIDTGRRLYREAIRLMANNNVNRLRAELMLAAEEKRSGTPESQQIVAAVIDAIARASNQHLKIWVRYVTDAKGDS